MFTSSFWTELFQKQITVLAHSLAYHPQSNGQSETVNKAIEIYLKCYIGAKPKSCPKWLTIAEWCYNTTFHTSIGMTPFQALYGFSPPRLMPYIPGTISNPDLA